MYAFTAFLEGRGAQSGCFAEYANRTREGEHPLVTHFNHPFAQHVISRLGSPLAIATPQLLVAEDYWRARQNGDTLATVHLHEKLGYPEVECHITDISSAVRRYLASLPPTGSLLPRDKLFLFGGVIVFQEVPTLTFQTGFTSGCGIGRTVETAAGNFIAGYRIEHRLSHAVSGYALRAREAPVRELLEEYTCQLLPHTLQ